MGIKQVFVSFGGLLAALFPINLLLSILYMHGLLDTTTVASATSWWPSSTCVCPVIYSSHGVFVLLFCIGLFLVVQPGEVSALTSLGLALRENQDQYHGILPRRQRTLKAATMEEMSAEKKNSTNTNSNFDPNQSSKRRVRRGSDPIHNRS
ncbi:unnamed protein product [Prunus armeniaca]